MLHRPNSHVFGIAVLLCLTNMGLVHGQIDIPSPNLNLSSRPPEELRSELELLDQELREASLAIRAYADMDDAEKTEWAERISHPHPETTLPLESELVEQCYSLCQPKLLRAHDAAWPVAHHAFGILMTAGADPSRLAALARQLLEAPLPATIGDIPHMNLYGRALRALIQTGDPDDLSYVLSTERPEFWRERAQGIALENETVFSADPDESVLFLRSRCPMVLSANLPEFAITYLDDLVEDEPSPSYRKFLLKMREHAQAKLEGNSPRPTVTPHCKRHGDTTRNDGPSKSNIISPQNQPSLPSSQPGR